MIIHRLIWIIEHRGSVVGLCCNIDPRLTESAVARDRQHAHALRDTDKDAAALRSSVVAKAERSPAAVTKQTTGQTEDGLPVHSFHTLLADLATLTRNTVVTAIDRGRPFTLTARPTLFSKRRSTSRPRRYPVIPSLGACFLREINNLRDHKEGSPV